jgi:hydrogenase maturation protease
MTSGRHVVVGVGNPYRGDDGVALAVLERLRERLPAGVELVACEQEPTRLLDAWNESDATVVVDAVASGAQPGTLHRCDATTDPVPARAFRSSTHAFSVGETIELARALGRLPAQVIVYGIEGERFDAGGELSPPVAAAVRSAAESILVDLRRLRQEEASCTSER